MPDMSKTLLTIAKTDIGFTRLPPSEYHCSKSCSFVDLWRRVEYLCIFCTSDAAFESGIYYILSI